MLYLSHVLKYTPYSAFQDMLTGYSLDKNQDQRLPRIPFYGLRHTSTTMNIYVHALKKNDSKAVDAIENILTKQA